MKKIVLTLLSLCPYAIRSDAVGRKGSGKSGLRECNRHLAVRGS